MRPTRMRTTSLRHRPSRTRKTIRVMALIREAWARPFPWLRSSTHANARMEAVFLEEDEYSWDLHPTTGWW